MSSQCDVHWRISADDITLIELYRYSICHMFHIIQGE